MSNMTPTTSLQNVNLYEKDHHHIIYSLTRFYSIPWTGPASNGSSKSPSFWNSIHFGCRPRFSFSRQTLRYCSSLANSSGKTLHAQDGPLSLVSPVQNLILSSSSFFPNFVNNLEEKPTIWSFSLDVSTRSKELSSQMSLKSCAAWGNCVILYPPSFRPESNVDQLMYK